MKSEELAKMHSPGECGPLNAVSSKIAHSAAQGVDRGLDWQRLRLKNLLTIWPFRVLITAEKECMRRCFADWWIIRKK